MNLNLASKFFSSFHFGSNSIYNIDIYADDTTLHFSDLWNQLKLAFNFILPLHFDRKRVINFHGEEIMLFC